MESKYYAPEIEEFHKGFEFEWFEDQFKKESFGITTDDDLEIIDDEIRERKIRVKYLDREDVESFGFVLKGKSIDLWFEKEGVLLREDGHHLTNIKLQYGLKDHKLKITLVYIGEEESVCFEGYIKNKNQLLTLLNSQLRL